MRKLVACALMLAFMAGITATSSPHLLAQSKKTKKDKDSGKKTKDAKKDSLYDSAGYVEIKENAKGKFYFSIRTAEGKYLAGSNPGGFSTEKEAMNALDEIKKALIGGKIVKGEKSAPKKKKKKEVKD